MYQVQAVLAIQASRSCAIGTQSELWDMAWLGTQFIHTKCCCAARAQLLTQCNPAMKSEECLGVISSPWVREQLPSVRHTFRLCMHKAIREQPTNYSAFSMCKINSSTRRHSSLHELYPHCAARAQR